MKTIVKSGDIPPKLIPLRSSNIRHRFLPVRYKLALENCTDCEDFNELGKENNTLYLIETYAADDVRKLLDWWGWNHSIRVSSRMTGTRWHNADTKLGVGSLLDGLIVPYTET